MNGLILAGGNPAQAPGPVSRRAAGRWVRHAQLRVTERARPVVHVPEVLYHWRMLSSSAAGRGETAKPLAYESGTRAIQAHCDQR